MKGKLGKISLSLLLLTQLAIVTGMVADAAGPPYPSGFYYTVRWGDTLYSIAYRFGTTPWAIARANGIYNPNYILAGQVLFIPAWRSWPPVVCPVPTAAPMVIPVPPYIAYPAVPPAVPTAFPKPPCVGYPPIVPTAVPTAIPEPTCAVYPLIMPTAIPVPTPQVAVCDPRVSILYPTVNAKLDGWGTTFIKGTASVDNFWYYKLEFGCGERPTDWSVIGELHYEPVVRGILGYWNTGALPEGVYTLRLVVVDKTGNYPEPCEVRVIIER